MHCFCCSLGEGEPTEDCGQEVETFPLSHDALLLLKHPFAIPKLLYLLCTSPCFLTPEVLLQYDGQLREMLRMLTSQVMTNDPSGSADGVLQ